jgi:hypothetical protein
MSRRGRDRKLLSSPLDDTSRRECDMKLLFSLLDGTSRRERNVKLLPPSLLDDMLRRGCNGKVLPALFDVPLDDCHGVNAELYSSHLDTSSFIFVYVVVHCKLLEKKKKKKFLKF